MSKPDLLCLATPNWEGDYAKTIVEIMTELSQDFRILYVDYAFTFKDVLKGHPDLPLERIKNKAQSLRALETKRGTEIHVLTPPAIWPINPLPAGPLYRFFLKQNNARIRRRVRWAMAELGMNDPLVVDAFNPAVGRYNTTSLGKGRWIYYCYDNIAAAPWLKKHGTYLEKEFIPLTDGVMTTSPGIQREKEPLHNRVGLVRNGVDFELFHSGFRDQALRADENAAPILGYIGSIDDRIDYQLLEALYQAMPQAEIHFVGRVMDEGLVASWRNRDRVVFHGAHPLEKLPEFLSTFSAALIPFVSNEFTKGIYPLKINEYLAAGVPVISTRFADLSDFETSVDLCEGHETFVQAVQSAVLEDDAEKRRRRAEVAQGNSWSARAETFKSLLREWFPGEY
ncbi:glycosyltransferase [Cryomorphaceae bacterium]|nr:glycosyltransferase [Cryomorphaceae bacterium]